MQYIKNSIESIKNNIKEICISCDRNPSDVELIAVTKTIDTDRINYALECGVSSIGENKVQEIIEKYDKIEKKVKWHLIGHLQTNKVKYIIDKVDLIHSVDNIGLVREIQKRAEKNNTTMDILIQVNVAEEDTKFGIKYDDIESFLKQSCEYDRIYVKGLMTIAPYYEDVEMTRPIFRKLRSKFDQLAQAAPPNVEMKYISMGMTNDYRVAVEEGANLVRIGTGIFGARNYSK